MGCEKILLLAGWIFRIVRFTNIKATILRSMYTHHHHHQCGFYQHKKRSKRSGEASGGALTGLGRSQEAEKKNENGPRRSQEARRRENLGFQDGPMGFQQIFFHIQCEKISVEGVRANFIVIFVSPRPSELWVLPA